MTKHPVWQRLPYIAACVFLVHAANAQPWPSKPVRLVAPVGAGSSADLVARTVAERLSERIGQPVVIDNRPGASGNIGMEIVARAAPDGYTLLYALTTLSINPHLQKLTFDPLKDFVAVATIATDQFVLLARPAFSPRSVKEIVALANTNPGQVTCGFSGGYLYIGCALLEALGKVDMTLVPYRSAPQIMADLLAGRIDLSFNASNAIHYAVAKGAIPIAMTSHRQASHSLADLAAIGETLKGFDLSGWQGIVAPSGTPEEVVQRLNFEIGAILQDSTVRARLEAWEKEIAISTPAAFRERILRDYKRYGTIIRQTGIRLE